MLPQETSRNFRLFALDVTPVPRMHAQTLDDRSYVHQANQIGLPVTIGVETSVLTYLPECSAKPTLSRLAISSSIYLIPRLNL